MDDLRPYMCIISDCPAGEVMYSHRTGLLEHIASKHMDDKRAQCPFCHLDDIPGGLKLSMPAFIKHIGHHMEEVAFGVVARAHEDWSYDESCSQVSSQPPNPPSKAVKNKYLRPVDKSKNPNSPGAYICNCFNCTRRD